MTETYDFISLGLGSAGMAGAIYAKRFGLKTMMLGLETGGLLNEANKVENYPGFVSIPGIDLMFKFREHVESLDIPIVEDSIKALEKLDDRDGKPLYKIITENKGEFLTHSILYALGSTRRKLGIPGEKEFTGKGVAYCATCDAPFFKDRIVGVVGGSDAAAQAALLLSQYAKQVYMIYRKDRIRAEPIHVRNIEKSENISIITNTNVVEVKGDKLLEKAVFDKEHDGSKEFTLGGLFIEIGADPNVRLAEPLGVELNKGHIKIARNSSTNLPGFYAAGDVADGIMKQAITAASEACIAAQSAFELLR